MPQCLKIPFKSLILKQLCFPTENPYLNVVLLTSVILAIFGAKIQIFDFPIDSTCKTPRNSNETFLVISKDNELKRFRQRKKTALQS